MQLTIVLMNTFCRIIVTSKATFHIVQFGKFGLGWAKNINIVDDANDPYELETDAMGENIQVENVETKSNGRINQETPLDIASTMRILRVELQCCREDNERMIKYQKQKNHMNTSMLQSLIDI